MNNSERIRNLTKRTNNQTNTNNKQPFQWRPFLALIGMIVIFILDYQWAWGILFLYWVIPDIFNGVTYFIEPVEREKSPFLFWSIVVSWIVMSVFSLSTLFINY